MENKTRLKRLGLIRYRFILKSERTEYATYTWSQKNLFIGKDNIVRNQTVRQHDMMLTPSKKTVLESLAGKEEWIHYNNTEVSIAPRCMLSV